MQNSHPQKESSTSRYSREASVYYLENYRQLRDQSISQREVAKQLNIPRSTLQGMADYENRGGPWKSGVQYWESREGLKMLMSIVQSAHLVFNQTGAAGIRMLIEFFELSGLSLFIANSYGSQQAYANQISSHIATFGEEENRRLGLKMMMKKITAVLDETFHPMPCLVAIEPVSNFILTETYSDRRRAEDWEKAMTGGMENLSIEIIQLTGDEGTALKSYGKNELGAHHSPDIWHQQSDLGKATFMSLQWRAKKAEEQHENAKDEREKWEKKRSDYSKKPSPGRPPDFHVHIEKSKEKEATTLGEWETAKKRQEDVSDARKNLSHVYHLFDLENGEPQSAEEVSKKMEDCLEPIRKVKDEKLLSDAGNRKVRKVFKVVKQMKATIDFVWSMTAVILKSLNLLPEIEMVFLELLLPALYFESIAQKASLAEDRNKLKAQAEKFRQRLKNGYFATLDDRIQEQLEQAALQCVGFFQRSSACVEGRNGVLRLRHHQLHQMSQQQLEVLTVLHNYWTRRPDGTNAAERFFEQKPRDLFEYLTEKMPPPSRPAQKRKTA